MRLDPSHMHNCGEEGEWPQFITDDDHDTVRQAAVDATEVVIWLKHLMLSKDAIEYPITYNQDERVTLKTFQCANIIAAGKCALFMARRSTEGIVSLRPKLRNIN